MKNTVLAKLNGLNIALTLWIICMIPAPIHYFLFGLKGIEILGKLAAFGLYGTFLLIPVCFYVLANAQ
ncbi:MAG: hypothetical protein L6Q71_03875, partial [Planctomycetes bacterium]|nr:hypothetical protein [Planctomycetota bacterium]